MKEAKDILEHSGARVIFASDLDEAAKKVLSSFSKSWHSRVIISSIPTMQAVKVATIVDMAQQAQLNVSFELPL